MGQGCGCSKKAAENVIAPESKPIKGETKEGEGTAPVSPSPAPFEFTVEVEREADEPLGVKVDFPTDSPTLSATGDNALLILLVRPEGLLPAWNAKNQEKLEVQVKEGDLIVDVNGVKNDLKQMMDKVTEKSVTLLIQRPVSAEQKKPAVEPAVVEPAVEPAAEPAAEPATQPLEEAKIEEPADDTKVEATEQPAAVDEQGALAEADFSATAVPLSDGIIPVELDETEKNDTEDKRCVCCRA